MDNALALQMNVTPAIMDPCFLILLLESSPNLVNCN